MPHSPSTKFGDHDGQTSENNHKLYHQASQQTSSATQNEAPICYFIDKLPAELRCMIYEELLPNDREELQSERHPQILAICKLINQEARHLLPMFARVILSSFKEPTIRRGPKDSLQPIRKPGHLSRELNLFWEPWSGYEQAIIEFELDFDHPRVPAWHTNSTDGTMRWWNVFPEVQSRVAFQLYILASQIQSSNIRDVHLKILNHVSDPWGNMSLKSILTPILHLGRGLRLHITGIDDQLQNEISQIIQATPTDGELALLHWMKVKDELRDLSHLLHRAGMEGERKRLKYVLQSLCGSRSLTGSHYCRPDEYFRFEKRLSEAAYMALITLSMGVWREMRWKAEVRLSIQDGT